ncbi:spermatogenesis-associated protein 5 [Caerostris extrusa]|uniref:Spermatogenesis-associated protein 5 n=1 Tax=Caerostris extrusa TaxID=172846 RepID=A0AAV4Y7E0_CAEEX|nr:spermatogenesis-associated protein 5 [Caerostris extrusa]
MSSKKKKNKKTSFSDNSSLAITDLSLNDETKIPQSFTVLFDNKKGSELYFTIDFVFLHPWIIKIHNNPEYFVVRGMQNFVLCQPLPLESIKKSTILFPIKKKDLRFNQGELVTLHPYSEKIKRASHITVHFDAEMTLTLSDNVKKSISWALRGKKFIYSGMKIKEPNLKEFHITRISCEENELVDDTSNLNVTYTPNNSSKFNDTSISFSESSSRNLFPLTSELEESSGKLDSMFSNLNLNDTEDSANVIPATDCVTEMQFPDFQMPTFFMNSEPHITIDSEECMNNTLKCFSHIGGLKEELQLLKLFINAFFNQKKACKLTSCGVVMLLGPHGTGKTLILEAIPGEYDVHVEEIIWFSLKAKAWHEARKELDDIYQRITNSRSQSLILIDDFDMLCPKEADKGAHSITRLLSDFVASCVGNQIVIIATAGTSDYDDTILKTSKMLVKEIKLKMPNEADRRYIKQATSCTTTQSYIRGNKKRLQYMPKVLLRRFK